MLFLQLGGGGVDIIGKGGLKGRKIINYLKSPRNQILKSTPRIFIPLVDKLIFYKSLIFLKFTINLSSNDLAKLLYNVHPPVGHGK